MLEIKRVFNYKETFLMCIEEVLCLTFKNACAVKIFSKIKKKILNQLGNATLLISDATSPGDLPLASVYL